MIESYYWKADLLRYAKKFQPTAMPPRWSEKRVVNFEKDVVLAFFIIRKLSESNKFSSKTEKHKMNIYRCPNRARVNARNYWNIEENYDLKTETLISKGVNFVCNQFIHGGAIVAYREKNRNWGGLYTCSDFERQKFIYRIPLCEIIDILCIAGNDYPSSISMTYDPKSEDDPKVDQYKISTN